MAARATSKRHRSQPSSASRAGYAGVVRCASVASEHCRRRGTVLILVMTILGVLFVTGIAFLATMEFEADMISADRQRDRHDRGLSAMVDEVSSLLQEGLVGQGGVPFGGRLDDAFSKSMKLGDAPNALGEIPGVHNFFAPTEPYLAVAGDPASVQFRNFTDLSALTNPGTMTFQNFKIDPQWLSGVPDINVAGALLDGTRARVDSDGDGITDTLQFDVARLGFSDRQVSQLSATLNTEDNPDGKVFLGARVIAHGAMVNLNESHPLLIANALDLRNPAVTGPLAPALYFSNCGANPNLDFFQHTPACSATAPPNYTTMFYSPQVEEAALRRRFILPPEAMAPTLLHGNPFLDPSVSATAGGDMFSRLFPRNGVATAGFETAFGGFHRSTPFSPNEFVVPSDPSSPMVWTARIDRETALIEANITGIDPFDRRHLVTTISHDDLLSRGGRIETFSPGKVDPTGEMDMRDWMISVNQKADTPLNTPPEIPFEYVDYPHDVINDAQPGEVCDTITRPVCEFDDRKGRLKLSLSWLDDAFSDDGNPGNDLITEVQRDRLIHDAFMMLVRNARGLAYDEVECAGVAGAATGVCRLFGETCDMSATTPICVESAPMPPQQTHRELAISRTAASLTANMLDYADTDNVPTRVALRSFDFSEPDLVGKDINLAAPGTYPPKPQYVYGLEKQPYITEVTTVSDGSAIVAWAVELSNPYSVNLGGDNDGDMLTDFWIFEVNAATGTIVRRIPLVDRINPGEFTVFVSGTPTELDPSFQNDFRAPAGIVRVLPLGGNALGFDNGTIIYLVRKVAKATYPGTTLDVNIVVDQIDLRTFSGVGNPVPFDVGKSMPPFTRSIRRVVPQASPWMATVPPYKVQAVSDHLLGKWKPAPPPNPGVLPVRPVEVNFANTGSLTKPDPDPLFLPLDDDIAFPTTGSMLLLIRHANRDIAEFPTTKELAFTTKLGETPLVTKDSAGAIVNSLIPNPTFVDNGRMPIFDEGFAAPMGWMVGRQYAHHADPASPGLGGLSNLPWGQLVFDYFTALPLASDGPYRNTLPNPQDFDPLKPDSQPRVDEGGLRVHGRININAAPWTVLAGLPLVPMDKIPFGFRNGVKQGVGLATSATGMLTVANAQAAHIGDSLAQGIVAYRETREIVAGTGRTGDYNGVGGHGLTIAAPASRRGAGFLSIGELANVRHIDAVGPAFRVDGGNLSPANPNGPDFVQAAALLIALGDWVSVRSHVFTVYGTLRGEVDQNILVTGSAAAAAADVDTRAIRFQETIDRLPTFSRSSEPARIGERISGKYVDVRND